jgi:hypothetical protein
MAFVESIRRQWQESYKKAGEILEQCGAAIAHDDPTAALSVALFEDDIKIYAERVNTHLAALSKGILEARAEFKAVLDKESTSRMEDLLEAARTISKKRKAVAIATSVPSLDPQPTSKRVLFVEGTKTTKDKRKGRRISFDEVEDLDAAVVVPATQEFV